MGPLANNFSIGAVALPSDGSSAKMGLSETRLFRREAASVVDLACSARICARVNGAFDYRTDNLMRCPVTPTPLSPAYAYPPPLAARWPSPERELPPTHLKILRRRTACHTHLGAAAANRRARAEP